MTAPTLAAFIEACVAEDQEAAIAAFLGDSDEVPDWHTVHSLMGDGKTREDAELIARNDPGQVLRTCAAVRAVLALHIPRVKTFRWQDTTCAVCADWEDEDYDGPPTVAYPCPTLTALAAMYAGRDGYGEAVGGEV